MEKGELRKKMVARLSSLGEEQRKAEDQATIALVLGEQRWKKAKSIFCYAPYGWEIDTFPLMRDALENGKKLALPQISEKGIMYARTVWDLSLLEKGPYGIIAPPSSNPLVLPEEIDLVVVPGVAFETEGLLRLGRGGGYYDRYLVHTKAFRLALVRSCQLTEGLIEMDPHDQTMDMLVTGDHVYQKPCS